METIADPNPVPSPKRAPGCAGHCEAGTKKCPTPHMCGLEGEKLPPLDMAAVTAEALLGKTRRWQLEFDCNGWSFFWRGDSRSMAHAESTARQEISEKNPDFRPSDARLVAFVEVAA